MNECRANESRSRRFFLQGSAKLLIAAPLTIVYLPAAVAAEAPPELAAILQSAARAEMRAYQRYVRFARKAHAEDYDGISYLFTALAASELIHAQNYNRSIMKLGADIVLPGNPHMEIADTKKNLIVAAQSELSSINNFYPKIVEQIETEANGEAMRFVRYAWESHRQHKDIIDKIKKYAPDFFETVARRIDENTDVFYVCEICGSTTYELPPENCPICGYTVRHYEKLEPRAFLG
jgi:rubrerythrin